MIRYQLTAQKQLFVGVLLITAFFVIFLLRTAFESTGLLLLTQNARIEIYLIGVVGAALYLNSSWVDLLRKSFHPAPFEAIVMAGRFAVIQGVAFTVIYFLLQDIATSRAFLGCFLLVSFPLNTLLILWGPIWLRRIFARRIPAKAILAGKGPLPSALIEYAARCRYFGIDFSGYYGDPQEEKELPFQHQGTFESLRKPGAVLKAGTDRVLFYGRDFDSPEYQQAVDNCHRLGIRAQIYLHQQDTFEEPARHIEDGDFHFLAFVHEPLQNPINQFLKRFFDIAISLPVVLFLLPPLTLLVWMVQRIQAPGPIFFHQTRYGMDRKSFQILKFRTMLDSGRADDEATQATADDRRIFHFGRFLRRTSLDEIPQFLNVLRGEMSVIGPRPHLTTHDEVFELEMKAYRTRHFVKPGITGYAQIRGFRGEITTPEQIARRVHHDLHYVNHWSLKLDCYIACKTVAHIFLPPRTAY